MNASKSKMAGIVVALSTLVGCGTEDAVAGPNGGVGALDGAQRTEIEQLLGRYEVALNAGDVKAVMRLYADDPVVMMQETPTSVGTEAVEGFYTGTFKAISLTLKFKVAEVKALGPEWAMLRSNSSGLMKVVANGAEIPSAFQELFLLRKEGGKWKFARYSFSSTQAAPK
ncbi:MAG: hypothetical protein JWP91_4053 [Fibrobacteres bacterium]|nr:hypothetical protein [Fibrobacterota bacterium]